MRSYLDGMLRYFEFSGRSTRMQYWMYYLVQLLLCAGAIYVDVMVFDGFANPRRPQMPLTLFVAFVHAIPNITVQVRRLHDIGRSGAWLLLYFVPIIGPLVLLFWSFVGSEPGRNAYDNVEPSSYEPRYAQAAKLPRYSTIPRQVRMGSNAGRPPSVGYDGLASPERFI